MSSRKAPHVAVIMGGPSAEREVSLVTGAQCAAALREEGFEVSEIDAGDDLPGRLAALAPDVVFNALHGRWGEDGTVQGLLEWLRIPYTHSGILASALAMDKERAKIVFEAAGLNVARSFALPPGPLTDHPMPPPYVVKPIREGSSVGIHLVLDANAPPPPVPDGAGLMVEEYVPGRELTVSVLGGEALIVTEIITEGWYDYEAKYRPGASRHVLPADLPHEVTEACLEAALTAHDALGCRTLSRSDFRWNEAAGAGGVVILETNTQPGMTPTSLTPEQAAARGIGFGRLCRMLVEDASCDR